MLILRQSGGGGLGDGLGFILIEAVAVRRSRSGDAVAAGVGVISLRNLIIDDADAVGVVQDRFPGGFHLLFRHGFGRGFRCGVGGFGGGFRSIGGFGGFDGVRGGRCGIFLVSRGGFGSRLLLLEAGGQVFPGVQQVLVHFQQDVGDAAVSFRRIVGRLAVILGVELVGADVAAVHILVFLHEFVVVGLDVLVRDGDIPGDMGPQAGDQFVARLALQEFTDKGIFGIAFAQQLGFRVRAGGRFIVLGGLFREVGLHIA